MSKWVWYVFTEWWSWASECQSKLIMEFIQGCSSWCPLWLHKVRTSVILSHLPPTQQNHREDWLQLIVVVLSIVRKLPPYAVFHSNRTSINWVTENQQALCVCFPLYVCSGRSTPKVPRHEKESLFRALGHEASSKSGSAHSSPSLLHRVLSKGHRRKIDAQGLGDVNCSINVAFEPDWLFISKNCIMYVQPFILC